jgi:hypothetical protein
MRDCLRRKFLILSASSANATWCQNLKEAARKSARPANLTIKNIGRQPNFLLYLT